MSVPARQLIPDRRGAARPTPRTAPTKTRQKPNQKPNQKPKRTPAAPPSAAHRVRRRTRRGHRTAFWLFSGVLVSAMVMGLVAVNALSVQTTYQTHQYQQEVTDLSSQQIELTDEIAARSAPGRVAAWAAANGMELPGAGDTVVLRVPGVLAPSTQAPGNA